MECQLFTCVRAQSWLVYFCLFILYTRPLWSNKKKSTSKHTNQAFIESSIKWFLTSHLILFMILFVSSLSSHHSGGRAPQTLDRNVEIPLPQKTIITLTGLAHQETQNQPPMRAHLLIVCLVSLLGVRSVGMCPTSWRLCVIFAQYW